MVRVLKRKEKRKEKQYYRNNHRVNGKPDCGMKEVWAAMGRKSARH